MNSEDTHRRDELMTRIAEGDTQAFRILFDTYRIRLFSFTFRLTHSAADAEEIIQEIFTKIWENRQMMGSVEYPENYIFRMARNASLNFLSKTARNKLMQEQLWLNIHTTGNTTEQLLALRESTALVHKLLSKLSLQKQLIFRLSREEGLTHEQIAEHTGLSKSRVNNLLVEIVRYLKFQLPANSTLISFFLAGRLCWYI